MGPLAKAAFTAAVLFIAGVILYGAAFVDNRAAGGLDGPVARFRLALMRLAQARFTPTQACGRRARSASCGMKPAS
jgi:hypothetical protein